VRALAAGRFEVSSGAALGARRTLATGALVGLAGVFLATLVAGAGSPDLGLDYREAYLPAAESLVATGDPYAVTDGAAEGLRTPYVYPPHLAIALVPMTALSAGVGAFLAFITCLAALAATMVILDVRDIRCYAVVAVWGSSWQAMQMANVSALLALALALMWRYRDRASTAGWLLGVACSLKLFLWPLVVWAAVAGRWRLAITSGVACVLVTFGSWAVIGFEGFAAYPDLLMQVSGQPSYSIVAVIQKLGYSELVGSVIAALVGGLMLGLAVNWARRGQELIAWVAAIAASLALTPVLWQHYLVLLVVPLALLRPSFSPVWLVPIAVWMTRLGDGNGPEALAPLLAGGAVLTVLLARPLPVPHACASGREAR
jgi:alpha-1,2-mannosyltransferase